jgi:hypothetical protein
LVKYRAVRKSSLKTACARVIRGWIYFYDMGRRGDRSQGDERMKEPVDARMGMAVADGFARMGKPWQGYARLRKDKSIICEREGWSVVSGAVLGLLHATSEMRVTAL